MKRRPDNINFLCAGIVVEAELWREHRPESYFERMIKQKKRISRFEIIERREKLQEFCEICLVLVTLRPSG